MPERLSRPVVSRARLLLRSGTWLADARRPVVRQGHLTVSNFGRLPILKNSIKDAPARSNWLVSVHTAVVIVFPNKSTPLGHYGTVPVQFLLLSVYGRTDVVGIPTCGMLRMGLGSLHTSTARRD